MVIVTHPPSRACLTFELVIRTVRFGSGIDTWRVPIDMQSRRRRLPCSLGPKDARQKRASDKSGVSTKKEKKRKWLEKGTTLWSSRSLTARGDERRTATKTAYTS
jgi:hypothetical protein